VVRTVHPSNSAWGALATEGSNYPGLRLNEESTSSWYAAIKEFRARVAAVSVLDDAEVDVLRLRLEMHLADFPYDFSV